MITLEMLNSINIHNGQIRSYDLVHNGGWYNELGEKIGWGDLNHEDLNNIARLHETFFILSENDSFWDFVTNNPGITGEFYTTDATEKNPGLDYILDAVRYAVVKGEVLVPARWTPNNTPRIGRFVKREELKEMFLEKESNMTFVKIDTSSAERHAYRIGRRGGILPQAYRSNERARNAHSQGMREFHKNRRGDK